MYLFGSWAGPPKSKTVKTTNTIISFGDALVQSVRNHGFLEDTASQRIPWSFSFYSLLPPLPWWFPSLRRRSCVVDGATEAGHLEILCSLNFDKWWFSALVSAYCKRTLLWWRWEPHSPVGVRISSTRFSSKIRDLTKPGYLTWSPLPGVSSLLVRGLKTNQRAVDYHQDECH